MCYNIFNSIRLIDKELDVFKTGWKEKNVHAWSQIAGIFELSSSAYSDKWTEKKSAVTIPLDNVICIIK